MIYHIVVGTERFELSYTAFTEQKILADTDFVKTTLLRGFTICLSPQVAPEEGIEPSYRD